MCMSLFFVRTIVEYSRSNCMYHNYEKYHHPCNQSVVICFLCFSYWNLSNGALYCLAFRCYLLLSSVLIHRCTLISYDIQSCFCLLLAKIYNFGKYVRLSVFTCQNFQFLQVCSFVGLSVCLSVLSSITHERFDISSPNLVHIWNGWAVPVCDIDK